MSNPTPVVTSAVDLVRQFSLYSDLAFAQPVVITRNSRPRNVLLSFEEYLGIPAQFIHLECRDCITHDYPFTNARRFIAMISCSVLVSVFNAASSSLRLETSSMNSSSVFPSSSITTPT
jgi:hypothetical protein